MGVQNASNLIVLNKSRLVFGQPQLPFCVSIRQFQKRHLPIDLAKMGSYAQQYGPGPVWYYEEPPRQPPPQHPAVPLRYSNHSGDMFNQPPVYTTYSPTDPGIPIQNPTTSFGSPTPFDHSGSSARQETSPVSGVDRSDRRRYRIKRIRTVSTWRDDCHLRRPLRFERRTPLLTVRRPVRNVVSASSAVMVASTVGLVWNKEHIVGIETYLQPSKWADIQYCLVLS